MPFWIKLIGQPRHNLFHLRTNLRYGCAILRHYLDIENGDYFRALGRYNGSLGQSEYPRRGAGRVEGPLEVRRADRMIGALLERRPRARQLDLRLHAAGARRDRARAPARLHRAGAPGLDVRRHARAPAGRLDQLRALARLRAHLPARRPRARRHGADRAQPRAPRGERRARRAGVRRRGGAVPPVPRRPRGAFDRPAILVRHVASGAQMVVDVPGGGAAEAVLAVPAARRGWLPLGRVMLETRFPLGLFRAWSYVEPDARCLVYPRPERSRAAAATARRPKPAACARPRPATTTSPACAATSPPIRRATWPGRRWRAATGACSPSSSPARRPPSCGSTGACCPPASASSGACRGSPAGCSPPSARGAHYGLRLPGVEIAPGARRRAPHRLPAGARAVPAGDDA